jgi:ethanolamine utilization protein EutL
MRLEPIRPRILSLRVLPNVAGDLAQALGLKPTQASVGLVTCTIDDCLYVALDEGTKAADVEVVYAHSFYAGSSHASGPFSGEVIGVFAGPTPEEVIAALGATRRYLEDKACFYTADEAGRLAFFPHVIPAVGSYLARVAEVEPGAALAYLIAPPLEAVLGLDAALKAGRVTLRRYYAPPTETNFAGGLLTGGQTDCEAAAAAFQETVLELAENPLKLGPQQARAREAELARRAPAGDGARYHLLAGGAPLADKPAGLTHLFDDHSLVPKEHPVIALRGKLDLLQAEVLQAQLEAAEEGCPDLARDLGDVLQFLRGLMACEVAGKPCPELQIGGLTADELHHLSHHTREYLGVDYLLPDASLGRTALRLNQLRARSRELELLAHAALPAAAHVPEAERARMLQGLNRLSNALYVLVCKRAAQRRP